MTSGERAERLWRAAALLALGVGTGSAVAPAPLLRMFGVRAEDLTGTGVLGWRLFGIRTAYVASAALTGSTWARREILPVQVADQVAFLVALADRSVPRRAVALAMATSGALVLCSLAAGRAEEAGLRRVRAGAVRVQGARSAPSRSSQ